MPADDPNMTAPRREDWARVRQVFEAALAEPAERRPSLIAASCHDAPAIRQQVMGLLAFHGSAHGFLEQPAVRELWSEGLPDPEAAPEPDPNVGRTLGPYSIESCIGRGGMGAVYLARRADRAFERRVAVKMVRRGMDSDVVVRRFEHERQILASLDHPHVARLYDGGTTPDGLPYFVMEYVEGEPITDYCRRHRLGTRARLAMFRTVCGAVQYAHQNLLVHRDLKPGNVLVGADGEPKLLDFGIAKLLAGAAVNESAGATLVSALTPDYASPEQVRGQTVTTATDVYSLGVVLYELLAGRRPFAVRASSLEDIVHAVCDTDPLPPSVASNGAVAADDRPCPPQELRGDLDTIVLRALRKEPERRYRSAQELADDIDRFLEGRAVVARGDAFAYRTAKFVGRHWTAVLFTAVLFASLVGGLVLVVREKQIADEHRRRAERRFADVRKLAGSFLFEVQDAIQHLPGATRARELVTRRAVDYLDGLAAEAGGDPTLQAELAHAYRRVGDVLGNAREANLGDAAGALASYRQALRLLGTLAAQRPLDRSLQGDLAETLLRIGDVQLKTRESEAALASFRRSQAIAEKLGADAPGDRRARVILASAHIGSADALGQLGDRTSAIDRVTRTMAILDALAVHPGDLDSRRLAARARKRLGSLYSDVGDTTRSVALQLEALGLSESLAAEHPVNQGLRNDVAMCYVDLGRAYLTSHRLADALRSYRRAEAITSSMVTADPSDAQARWLNGLELNSIGFVLTHMRRSPEAVASHTRALVLLDALAQAEPRNETYQYNVANTQQLIGDAYVSAAAPSSRATAEAWRNACVWYRKSAHRFDAIRRRGTLTAALAPDAAHVAARFARCEALPR
jgi:eukaryotic-like serine/threonine-protein kinase